MYKVSDFSHRIKSNISVLYFIKSDGIILTYNLNNDVYLSKSGSLPHKIGVASGAAEAKRLAINYLNGIY